MSKIRTKIHQVHTLRGSEIIVMDEKYETGEVVKNTAHSHVTDDNRYFPFNYCLHDKDGTIWCRSRFVKRF